MDSGWPWLSLFESTCVTVSEDGALPVSAAFVRLSVFVSFTAVSFPTGKSPVHSFSSSGILRALSCCDLLRESRPCFLRNTGGVCGTSTPGLLINGVAVLEPFCE